MCIDYLRDFLHWKEVVHVTYTKNCYYLRLAITEAASRCGLSPMSHVWECDLITLRDTMMRAPLRGMEAARLSSLRLHIRERGFLSAMYRGVPPPDWIGGGDAVSAGEHKAIAGDDEDPSGLMRRTLPGIGCSPGRATGVARVIRSLDDSHLVKKVVYDSYPMYHAAGSNCIRYNDYQ